MTLNDLVESQASQWGDKTFVLFKEEQATFNQLAERSRRVANGLAKLGLGKGDKVAVLLPNCLEFLYSFFGITRLGAVIVPINPLPYSEVQMVWPSALNRATVQVSF